MNLCSSMKTRRLRTHTNSQKCTYVYGIVDFAQENQHCKKRFTQLEFAKHTNILRNAFSKKQTRSKQALKENTVRNRIHISQIAG